MTVGEKIVALNTGFQKLYYDHDAWFFRETLPQKLEEIKEFMYFLVGDTDKLRYHINALCTEKVDSVITLSEDVVSKGITDFSTRDNYLNAAKANVSHVLWEFQKLLQGNNRGMLEQII